MKYIIPLLLFTSCANLNNTKFSYTDNTGKTVKIEMPKEVVATDLRVEIDPETGKSVITAKTWESSSTAVIQADAERNAKLASGITEGAIKGALKAVAPVP